MPDEAIVTEEQYKKDEEDFNSIFEDISSKSDEDIKKDEDAAKAEKDKDERTGESDKDPVMEGLSEIKPDGEELNQSDGAGQKLDQSATNTDDSMLQLKIDSLEAELKKERQRTASWDGRIKASNQKAKDLEAENTELKEKIAKLEAASETAEGQSEQEVLDTFRKGFPELADVVDILQKKIDGVSAKSVKAKTDPEPKPAAKPAEEDPAPAAAAATDSAATDDSTDHMGKIRKVHKDIDEIVSTGVMQTWINSQSDSIRPLLHNIYTGQNGQGSAEQVITMTTNFKKNTGWRSQLDTSRANTEDKLNSMREAEGESAGPTEEGPDKNDFAQGAKDAGL